MNALIKTDNQVLAEPAQYLTFMLGGEMFAITIVGIKEIIEYAGLTPVPMMPSCILGVMNLRGSVVPVMDLSARFGKPTTALTKRTCIVIVEVAAGDVSHDMGILVDAVNAVLEIPTSEIEPAPAFGAKIRTDFMEGMGKVNGKFVILLNINRVLSVEEIGVLAQPVDVAPLLLD